MASDRTLIWLKYRFIGDAVLATPLIHAVSAKMGHADLLGASYHLELLAEEPRLSLHLDTKLRGMGAFLDRLRWLRQQRFSQAVIINRNFRTALLARLAGIPRRIGFATEGRSFLLTDRVPYDPTQHEAIAYAGLGKPLGLDVTPLPPCLHVSPAEKAKGRELLQGATIGIQPGATGADRIFPPERLAEIVNQLDQPVSLFGAASERSFSDALLPHLEHAPIDLVGKCTLRESMAALSQLKVFAAADSGLVHTAVALGVRTVATFSRTPAHQWGHDYPPHRVLVAPKGIMAEVPIADVVTAIRGE
ncbi:MAG: glycosyltransferase family 9 protein [Methanoregulaceae archaeon]|nr:glycosyltransferase family 9 protein [Methanoregulaceae archaeon]